MWHFKTEQQRFTIGKVSIGGAFGENPTVLVGSIFYHKQKSINLNEENGEFNQNEAEHLIKLQEEFSDKTGLPCMLDVMLPSKKSINRIIDFSTSVTDTPILVDAASAEIRMDALDYVGKIGIQDRCIYNSVNPESKKAEFDKMKETGVNAAVLLAYNARDITTAGRLTAMRQLLPSAAESGIEKILIDTCVLDIPTLGSASKAIFEVKNQFGYPSGCGAHNAIRTWKGLKTKMGLQAHKPCDAVATALPIAAGADFILYGPLQDAPYIFPAAAMANAAFAQLLVEQQKVPSPAHPIFRIA